MRLSEYLKDKAISILINFIAMVLVSVLLIWFKVNIAIILLIVAILIISYWISISLDFAKRKIFYDNFRKNLEKLDQKYLVTEIINEANFIDGKLILEFLYEIDKSMHEQVNDYKFNINEFKDYIELWCHEIKTPIATSKLVIENNNDKVTRNILEEIEKIDEFVEQVLYYSRSDTVEKDYIISKTNLNNVVSNVIKRNKKYLINKKIKIEIDELAKVNTDSKWIEFIINQIVTNSIKYSKPKDGVIKIYSKINKNNAMLMIEDNGIGVENDEVNKVFEKGFTGSNGRKKYNSTGIGLYLCDKLCKKLGHEIMLNSKVNEKTVVTIIFPQSSMYK